MFEKRESIEWTSVSIRTDIGETETVVWLGYMDSVAYKKLL